MTPGETIAPYRRQSRRRLAWFVAAVCKLAIHFEYPTWRLVVLVWGLLYVPWFIGQAYRRDSASLREALRARRDLGVNVDGGHHLSAVRGGVPMTDRIDAFLKVFVNPLAYRQVDEPWSVGMGPATVEGLLDYLCTPGEDSSLDGVVKRYREISKEETRIIAVPAGETVAEKLMGRITFPLRQAKGAYALGNYTATIALCGMVAEMLAILVFEFMEFQVNGKPLTEQRQRELFGSTFEGLRQQRRIDVLSAYGLVTDDIREDFTHIRKIRNQYAHRLSKSLSQIRGDARSIFITTVRLFVAVVGQDIDEESRLRFKPNLMRYLRRLQKDAEQEQEG